MTQEERERIQLDYDRLQRVEQKEGDLKTLKWLVSLIHNDNHKFDYQSMIITTLSNYHNRKDIERIVKGYVHMGSTIDVVIKEYLEQVIKNLEDEIERM